MSSFGWNCTSCTYFNAADTRFCGMCAARRDSLHQISNEFHSVDSAQGWECTLCTLHNDESITHCEACNNPKYGHSSIHDFPQFNQGIKAEGVSSNERRLVLIGKTGSGKSATGNSILGTKNFESLVCGESITKKCKKGEAMRFGKKLLVIDTPGLFDTGMTNEMVTKEIVKCIGMTSPGPHAIILVVQIGRFTKEEQDTVKQFADNFGEGMYRHLIVLFTRKDDIVRQGMTIHQYVSRVPQELKNILRDCGNRYAAIDNVATTEEKDTDTKELLDIVEKIMLSNGGSCYTNEMYVEAEHALKRRMDLIRKEEREKKDRQIKKIERSISMKFQSKLDKEIKEKEKHQREIQDLIEQGQQQEERTRSLKNTLEITQCDLHSLNLKQRQEEQQRAREHEEFERQRRQFQNEKDEERERSRRREIEEHERKLRDIEERERKMRKEMDREREKRIKEKEEECRRRTEPEEVRKQVRDECENEGDILSQIWSGVKTVGKGFLSIGKGVVNIGKKILKLF